MTTLDRTRALMTELGSVIGLPDLPQDASGGYRLVVAGSTEVLIYGGDDVTILVVAPIAPLPVAPGYALVNYLFRINMFNADTMPFVTAVDEAGTLVFWGRIAIDDFDGTSLARLVDNVADKATELRKEVAQT